ncbi:MAG TPA: alpha/beta hydrolase [Allosphingosinicella sp.]
MILLVVLGGLYLAILLALFLLQGRMLFPAGMAGGAGAVPAGAQRLTVQTPDGHRLQGIHMPAAAPSSAPLILGFGGNAWNAEAAAAYLHDLYPQAEIVAFHYRGYAPSTGTPGAAALLEDSLLVHDTVVRELKPRRVVTVGLSIGTGVAAHVAAHRPVAGAILVTPFDSLWRVAAGHYPWIPVRLLFRHRMEPAEALRHSAVPIAIVAAANDMLIPRRRTDALRHAVPNLVFDRTIPGAGHNDIYQQPDFHVAMREALRRIQAAAAGD